MFEGIEEKQNGIVLGLNVSPGKRGFEVCSFAAGRLKLKTKSKAQKGLANKEIKKELERIFNSNVKILSGSKSRNKKVFIEGLNREKVVKLLEGL